MRNSGTRSGSFRARETYRRATFTLELGLVEVFDCSGRNTQDHVA